VVGREGVFKPLAVSPLHAPLQDLAGDYPPSLPVTVDSRLWALKEGLRLRLNLFVSSKKLIDALI
jgi:hypothetical protein